MERQKSFSFKPTRFLLFSFTVFSAVIFFTFFIWVMTAVPSDGGVQLSKPPVNWAPKPVNVATMSGFSRRNWEDDVKKPVVIDANLWKHENESGSARIPVFEGIQRRENVSDEDTSTIEAVKGNFTAGQESVSDSISFVKIGVDNGQSIEEKKDRGCDASRGRWVFDESYPLYTNQSCPFIDEGFDCVGNGKLNKDYMKWRWQPQDCDIPRYYFSHALNWHISFT